MKKQILRIAFILLFVLLLPKLGRPQALPTTSQEERLLFEEAKRLIQDGHVPEGITSLDLFFLNHPESPLAPDVLIESGKASSQQGNLKKAVESFRLFLEKFPRDSRGNGVRSRLSDAYLGMGNVEEALSLWKEIAGQEALKIPIYTRAVEMYIEQEEYTNALHALVRKKGLVADPIEAESVASAIVAIIRNRLTEKELQTVSSEYRPGFPSDEAMIQLIKFYDKKGIPYLTEKESKRFLSLFPNHAYAAEAKRIISVIRAKIKENDYLIGVILPLSGKLSQFGISALQGAELALNQFKHSIPDSPVGLVVRDSNDNSTEEKGALEEWLNDYLPLGIVGPLMSQDVRLAAPSIEKGRWALITPGATAADLPSMGRTVFRNATTPASQCHAIAEYAARTLGLKRFAILFPSERHEKEWVRCLRENVGQMGGKIVLAEPYLPNETDFKDSIARLKKAYEQGEGFDAIFLPGEARTIGLILPQLVFHNLKDVVLLGAMGWNDPDFLKLAGQYAEGAVFVDGFFEESPDPFVQRFVSQYREKFHEDPNLFAAQAYDAANIILEAIKQGAVTRSDVRSVIAQIKAFEAVSGYIFEVKDGEAIKKPFLIQVKKGKLVQVNP
ncbi:MAG: ABC transporter substrate-binding protein [Nitrospirae bacterium]|nr:ABC transporter substrate-binding protein [Candidatus Troglogloeales bacterium]